MNGKQAEESRREDHFLKSREFPLDLDLESLVPVVVKEMKKTGETGHRSWGDDGLQSGDRGEACPPKMRASFLDT